MTSMGVALAASIFGFAAVALMIGLGVALFLWAQRQG
jgi:hypothetical protein